MANEYNDLLTRTDAAADLPEQLAADLVSAVVRESVLLSLARSVPTLTRDSRIPVLSQLPQAYWVVGDSGMKQTTNPKFANQPIIAEEIAAICPFPQSLLDDSKFDLWAATKPLLARACAKKLDDAGIWGINPPTDISGVRTWPLSIAETAAVAGAKAAFNADPVLGVLGAAEIVSAQGYNASGAAVRNGWEFSAAIARAQSLVANPAGQDTPYPLLLAGLGIHPRPVSWKPRNADAIVADWSNVVIGMRQDISIKMFDSGVITNDSGVVVTNLMQQDSVAARVTMRVGFRVLAPPTDVDPTSVSNGTNPLSALCPAAIVGPATAGRSDAGGATTNASTTVTDTHAVATDVGLFITGTNIPPGTLITSVTPGTGYVLSQPATATGSSLTFTVGG